MLVSRSLSLSVVLAYFLILELIPRRALVPYPVAVQNIDQDPADANGSRRYLDQPLGVLPLSGQGILSVWRRRCHGGLLRGYVRLLLLPVRFILRQALLGQPKCDRRDQDYQVCLD